MDVDGDHLLEEADFVALTERWTAVRKWPPGSAGHTQLSAIMMGWWATLLAEADTNRDNKVTLDEVLNVVHKLGDMLDAVTATACAMFDAIDENADGRISSDEYQQLIQTWTGQPTDTDDIFALLDGDGDGHLDRAEFIDLWTEFWVGHDADSPGSLVFGRY